MRDVCFLNISDRRPVPWQVPRIGTRTSKSGRHYRFTTRNKDLETWQECVARHAREKMAEDAPATGPLVVTAQFNYSTAEDDSYGRLVYPRVIWNPKKNAYVKKGRAIADTDNLFKASIDALQGICFGNDGQICIAVANRRWWPTDGAIITITELDPTETDFDAATCIVWALGYRDEYEPPGRTAPALPPAGCVRQ
jgi:Holliday junction resolvase RusA-like endonuclease